jgi:hypothetical protein
MIGIIIGILLIALVIGLLTREKGDSFMDTLGSGCSTIIGIILVVGVVIFFATSGFSIDDFIQSFK